MEPNFLSLEDALCIHEDAIATYGGTTGVRDAGMLESALGAPQNLYAYGQADVSTRAGWALLAAAYWFHVSMNHPFIDGNKRASLMCCLAFLNTNGFDLEMSYEAGLELSIAIATHGISRDELATKLIPLLVAVVE